MADPTAGVKTSEFWVTVGSIVLVAALSALVTVLQTAQAAFADKWWAIVLGTALSIVIMARDYVKGRTTVKVAASQADSGAPTTPQS